MQLRFAGNGLFLGGIISKDTQSIGGTGLATFQENSVKSEFDVRCHHIEYLIQSDGAAQIINDESVAHFEDVAYCAEMNVSIHSLALYTKKEYEDFIFAIDQLAFVPDSMVSFCKGFFPIWDDSHQIVKLPSFLFQYMEPIPELCMLEFANSSKYLCSQERADELYQIIRVFMETGRL